MPGLPFGPKGMRKRVRSASSIFECGQPRTLPSKLTHHKRRHRDALVGGELHNARLAHLRKVRSMDAALDDEERVEPRGGGAEDVVV